MSDDSGKHWRASWKVSCLPSLSRSPKNDWNVSVSSQRWNVIVNRIVSRTSFRTTITACASHRTGQIRTDILTPHILRSAVYKFVYFCGGVVWLLKSLLCCCCKIGAIRNGDILFVCCLKRILVWHWLTRPAVSSRSIARPVRPVTTYWWWWGLIMSAI